MGLVPARRGSEPSRSKPCREAPDDGPRLATRWLASDGTGGTLRDAALARLALRRKGSAPPASEEERDLRGIRLSGVDLSGLDLSSFDLSRADLSGADLAGSRLAHAKLTGANLSGARLEGCEFLNADLRDSDLSGCKGMHAGFGNADLCGANLFHADFTGTTFTRASLSGTDLRAADLGDARLLETELGEADLSRATLRGVDMEKSRVHRAAFVDADLRNARLRGISGHATADWIGADILGVDFCGAYLVRRTIEDQNYLHEFRSQSRLNATLYWVWWITSDCGRSFLRWGLWTVFLVSVFAGLYEGVALDHGSYPTFLSSFYYSVVTLTTLGYGDVVPASPAAQVLAMCEVAVGYMMLGGLLSIFSNKMARRAG